MKLLPPGRTLWAMLIVIMLCHSTIVSQSLKFARANAIAAFSPFSRGITSLEWNPAGLTTIKDWELDASYFYSLYGSSSSFSVQHASVGKRFLGEHAAAIQLSPGSFLEFVVPSTFVIADSVNPVVSSYDKTISYSERYSLGYAFRANDNIALGFAAKYHEESISDTRYTIDTGSIIRSSVVDYSGAAWNINFGMIWNLNKAWAFSVRANNLFHLRESALPDEVQQYQFNSPKEINVAVGFSGWKKLLIGMEATTQKQIRFGGEWSPVDFLAVRSGLYLTSDDNIASEAWSFGIGGSYKFVHADLSYLTFWNQENRQGIVDITKFESSGIENIDYNPYTSDRITLSLNVQLGVTRESLVKIEYVEMLNDVFPSSRSIHAFRPIGKARVRNVSGTPLDAKVSFYVNNLMDNPTETAPYTIPPGEVLEIPFFAVFNDIVQSISSLAIHDGEVFVTASPIQEYDDSYQARVLIHGRNDWNGDVTTLRYFITPTDPAIVKFTRTMLSQAETQLDTIARELQLLEKAKLIFNEFVSRLVYVNDPKSTQDFVQYPSETLTLRGGDCDDMTVSYSTLLAGIGISTAFIDVIPPANPQDGHIYMMFNTGLEPAMSNLLSDNPKRFVVRKDERGRESVWIPIETTAIRKGFEEAWRIGAEQYFQDAELNGGLIHGWVRVVDVQPEQ